MAVVKVQSLDTGSGSNFTLTTTFTAAATAGNLLVSCIGAGGAAQISGITVPTGFTLIHSTPVSGNVSGALAYKIAAGGETGLTWTWSGSRPCVMWSAEYSGLAASAAFDVSAENETNLSTVVTSQSSGTTATTAQAASWAIALFVAPIADNVLNARAYTNSFTEEFYLGSASRPCVIPAVKTLSSTGAIETTFSTSSAGDEMYSVIAVFKQLVAGGAPVLLLSDYGSNP